ncbi:MAG: ABC-type Fe3+-siderophore transport system, permease 2 component [uncultured Nocardioides sp.]|uniref:ABC-type Fe3+-siderophore transport system, permease 2 component n=1 Tax=uncultured Nocardioides sp. TaxID=198441 RepID=A0A6J4NGC8_9ACTN|nr:MAG: ABC-type Fe3+-siderophore transport system, permease 2 component [uncultured Nocardioides sp.]
MTAMLTPALVPTTPTATTDALAVVRAARRGPRRRHLLVVVGLGVLLVLAFAARVLLGDYTITVPDFFRILSGTDIPGASYILMESKLPRAVLAVLTGLAFGVAGALFQTTLRNPLASPDIIGVNLGASALAVVAIALWGWQGLPVSGVAILGAVGVALVVRLVAGTHGGHRLILVGIGVAAAMQSVIQYVFTRVDEYDAQLVLRWLTGSVNGVEWSTIRLLAVALALLLPLTGWLARSLRISELGDDAAAGLGVPGARGQLLLLAGVVLCAVSVAAAGPIAFVSFLAGPIARGLNSGRTTLLGSALAGAVIVVAADYVGDYLIPDTNLPVGVVTGAIGAPFLLWLLARGRTGRRAA